MSFSSEQKLSILNSHIKAPCCRRSLLQGALFGRATARDGVITLSVEQRSYAEGIAQLVREFYFKSIFIFVYCRWYWLSTTITIKNKFKLLHSRFVCKSLCNWF